MLELPRKLRIRLNVKWNRFKVSSPGDNSIPSRKKVITPSEADIVNIFLRKSKLRHAKAGANSENKFPKHDFPQ